MDTLYSQQNTDGSTGLWVTTDGIVYHYLPLTPIVGTGSPVGTVTPLGPWQRYVDGADEYIWIPSTATNPGLNNTDWVLLNCANDWPVASWDKCDGFTVANDSASPTAAGECVNEIYITQNWGIYQWDGSSWNFYATYPLSDAGTPDDTGTAARGTPDLYYDTAGGQWHRWNGFSWQAGC